MAGKYRKKCRIACSVIGASLLVLPNGVSWYWGNVSTLALSYIVLDLGQESGVETPWVISLYIIFRALGLIAYDWTRKKVGMARLLVIGIAISDAGLLLCYLAVQHSLALINVALGIAVGFGSGLLYGHSMRTVLDLTDTNVGLLTSLVQGSFAAGAFLINGFVTLYANPSNLSPDLDIGFSSFFSQKDILDRVPSVFLYMGGFSLLVHAVSFIILTIDPNANASGSRKVEGEGKQRRKEEHQQSNSNSISKHGQETKTRLNDGKLPFYNGDAATKAKNYNTAVNASTKLAGCMTTSSENKTAVEDSFSTNRNSTKEASRSSEEAIPTRDTSDVEDPLKDRVLVEEEKRAEYSPKEMLKTVTFYVLWFGFFVGDFPIVLIVNYYKSFGQMFIDNDHFLTIIGTAIVFFNTWIRVVWGVVIDNLGPKNSLIAIIVPLVLVNGWCYLSAVGGKWTYFFLALFFGSLSGALYSIFPAASCILYGKKHFSNNFGLLTTASIVFNLVGPPVLELLLNNFGWMVTFSTSAVLNAISAILCLKFVPWD